MLLLLPQDLMRILRHKLERRVRLWHKACHADRHLHAFALRAVWVLIKQFYNALRRLGNALDVLQCFSGQAHHEIQLYRSIARIESKGTGFFYLLHSDVFIDDVTQALRAGLRRKCEAAFAHAGGFFYKRLRKIINAQAGQRHAHMLFARPFQHVVQQFFQLAVVACGKACKRNFIIARVLA